MLNHLLLRTKSRLPGMVASLVLCLKGPWLRSEPAVVSRTPPEIYEKQLKPLLSTWESIAERVQKAPPAGENAVVEDWVREEFIWVDDNGGKVIKAAHGVSKALNDEGARLLADARVPYGAKDERLHVPLARSTRDGRVFKEVADEGLFIKRPETPDSGVMHTDQETLTVVFPDVTKGSLTECVVVSEDTGNRILGHFMRNLTWTAVGTIHLRRAVVILPAAMEKGLRWKALGAVIAEPLRRELPGGRVMLEWRSEGLPAVTFEDRAPPIAQAGPALRLSTLPDWDTMGRWYADEIKQSGDVSAAQAAEAAQKTAGAGDARAKAVRLYDHVTHDVRYTGLEFGRGRYQPRAPAMVAETRYGDCKDKANLLRVLLEKQGIMSRIALLDTRHAGIIDHSIPSPGRFNHAILAVTLPGEASPVFCDPTQEGAPFGMLSMSGADREALVIGMDGGVEWLRIPKQRLARFTAEVDLVPEPGGGASGWVRVGMEDVLGHHMRHRWEKQNAEGRREIAKGTGSGLPGEEVIDFTANFLPPTKKQKTAPFDISTYVLKPGAAITGTQTTERLTFPNLGLLLPTVGSQPQRQTSITSIPFETQLTGGYALSKGWLVLDLPAPFKREAAGCLMQATWKEQGSRLLCDATMSTTQTLIHPAEHPALWQARRDFAEWLAQPALLKRPALPNPDTEAEADEPYLWKPDPASLPKMPHALGQVQLLEKRFPVDPQNPFDGDYEARRIAAKKLLKDFPKDPVARFEGEMRLILSDVMKDFDFAGLEKRIEPLLVDAAGDLTVEQIARGRVMLAGALAKNKKMKEAQKLALANYHNERVPLLLRQFSAGVAALTFAKDEPERAVEMGRVALASKGLPSITLYPILSASFSSLARLPSTTPATLQAETRQLLTTQASEAEMLREALLELPEELVSLGYLEAAEKLAAGIDLSIQEGGWEDDAKDTLKYTRESLADARAFAPIHQRLVAWLKEHPWPEADKLEKDDKIEDAATSQETAGDYYDQEAIRLRYLLRALTHYGPQENGSELLEEAAECANDGLAEKAQMPPHTEALLDELLKLWADVPGDEDASWDSDVLRGHVIERRAGVEKAIEHFRKMLVTAGKNVDLQTDAQRQIARSYERAQNFPQLLVEMQKMQQWPGEEDTIWEALETAHLAVALGDHTAAWSSYEWFMSQPDEEMPNWRYLPKEALKKMLADRKATEKWWGRTSAWWPEWEALAKKDGLVAPYGHSIADTPQMKAEEVAEDADEELPNKDKTSFVRLLHRTIQGARIYPHMAEAAARLLRNQAAKAYPQHRSNFQKLADKMAP